MTGGYDSANTQESVEVYTIATNTWTVLPSLPNQHVTHGSVFAPDGRLYAIGGSYGGQVDAYDPNFNVWVTLPQQVTNNTDGLSASLTGDGRIVAVTNNSSSSGTFLYGPSATISATQGLANSTFTVTGSNFAANANVSVILGAVTGGTVIGTGVTSGSGTFGPLTATVPATAAFGNQPLNVIDARSTYPEEFSFFAGSFTATGGTGQSGPIRLSAHEPVRCDVRDPNGNLLSGVTVTFKVTAGGGTFTGGVSTINVTTGASGQASTLLTLGDLAGTQTVSATASGLSLTFSATGTPAAPASLAFSVQPSAALIDVANSPGIQVSVLDQFSNVVPNSGLNVTVTLNETNGATLAGTTTVATVNGVATFSTLSVNKEALYTLTASYSTFTTTSASFLVGYSSNPPSGSSTATRSTTTMTGRP